MPPLLDVPIGIDVAEVDKAIVESLKMIQAEDKNKERNMRRYRSQDRRIAENIKKAKQKMDPAKTFQVIKNNMINREILDSFRNKKYKPLDGPKKPKAPKQFACEICGTAFAKKANLAKHTKIHLDEKPFQCEVCEAKFTTKSNMSAHMRLHTGEKPYKCTICDAAFSQRGNLTKHHSIHTGEKPYKCYFCEAAFSDRGSMKSHLMLHTGQKPFKCDECPAEFTVEGKLIRHRRIHTGERPYKCEICSAAFIHKTSLNKHMKRQIHNGDTPFKCHFCDLELTSQVRLNNHLRTHTEVKPYKCDSCHAEFSMKCSLAVHQRIHTGEKPFKCDACDATFSQRGSLTVHQRIHSGTKPFTCLICDAAFFQKGSLVVHMKLHATQIEASSLTDVFSTYLHTGMLPNGNPEPEKPKKRRGGRRKKNVENAGETPSGNTENKSESTATNKPEENGANIAANLTMNADKQDPLKFDIGKTGTDLMDIINQVINKQQSDAKLKAENAAANSDKTEPKKQDTTEIQEPKKKERKKREPKDKDAPKRKYVRKKDRVENKQLEQPLKPDTNLEQPAVKTSIPVENVKVNDDLVKEEKQEVQKVEKIPVENQNLIAGKIENHVNRPQIIQPNNPVENLKKVQVQNHVDNSKTSEPLSINSKQQQHQQQHVELDKNRLSQSEKPNLTNINQPVGPPQEVNDNSFKKRPYEAVENLSLKTGNNKTNRYEDSVLDFSNKKVKTEEKLPSFSQLTMRQGANNLDTNKLDTGNTSDSWKYFAGNMPRYDPIASLSQRYPATSDGYSYQPSETPGTRDRVDNFMGKTEIGNTEQSLLFQQFLPKPSPTDLPKPSTVVRDRANGETKRPETEDYWRFYGHNMPRYDTSTATQGYQTSESPSMFSTPNWGFYTGQNMRFDPSTAQRFHTGLNPGMSPIDSLAYYPPNYPRLDMAASQRFHMGESQRYHQSDLQRFPAGDSHTMTTPQSWDFYGKSALFDTGLGQRYDPGAHQKYSTGENVGESSHHSASFKT